MSRATPCLIALLLVASVAAAPVRAAGYADELKAASAQQFDCYGGGEDAACRAMLAAYERAMAAPDANPGLAHAIFKLYAHTYGVYGAHLRKAGRVQDSLVVLTEGHQKLVAHVDGGRHFHAWFDHQRLLAETAITLLELGRNEEAQSVLQTARSAVQRAYDSRAQAAASEHATKVLHGAYREARDFETQMARYYSDRTRDQEDALAQSLLLEKAQEAFGRAEAWLAVEAEAGVAALQGWAALQSELNYERGMLLLDLDKEAEAERAFARAYAAGCEVGDAGERARLGDAANGILPGKRWPLNCEKVSYAWSLVNGDLDEAIEAAVDRMFEEQMRALEASAEEVPALD